MIRLLLALVFIEMPLILTLLFANPVRELVIKGLNYLKQSERPLLVIKTVSGTLLVVLGSTVESINEIQKRSKEAGLLNPTDELLMAYRLLEASLMGFSLFLGLVIDRQHDYNREIISLNEELEAARKLKQNYEQSEKKGRGN